MIAAASIISTDMVAKSISLTTSSIFTLGKSLLYSDNYVNLSSIEKIEKKLDLLETIKIYDIWIQEIIEKYKDKIENSNSFKESIRSFTSILNELHELLKTIDQKVQNHKLKWFNYYRTLSFHEEIENMQILKNILDNRFNILQQINSFQ
jgi:hypothetical protein